MTEANLANNGGPTRTMALQVGSIAIHAWWEGTKPATFNPFAVDPYGRPLQFDQRGQGYARISSGAVDTGAVHQGRKPHKLTNTTTL